MSSVLTNSTPCMRNSRGFSLTSVFTLPVLVLLLGAVSPVAQAALVSQISSINGVCGADVQGGDYKGCTAGEISLSQVSNVIISGNPVSCTLGESLTVQTATVEYNINTSSRNDLIMWIGDQQGTDPRLSSGGGATCSAFSVPAPFNATPNAINPWGDVDADQCGDLAFSVAATSRNFSNIGITCQDNDQNGKADLQVLLTWSQNAGQACGTGAGQSFPTVGAVSKCDFNVINTTVNIVQPVAGLTLDKTSPTANYSGPGNTIVYSYLVTNSGTLALNFPVTVADNKATVTCPANDGGAPNNGNAVLDPGESITCSASYNVTQADINAGSVTNTATASAAGTQSNQDQVTVPAVQSPAMTVVKTSTTTSISAPGTVNYSYLVTNTGNVTLTGISLSDDNDQNNMSCPGTSLAPAASFTCTASHLVTQAEINANGSPTPASGNLVNNVTATSTQSQPAMDDLSIPIVQSPSLDVLKTGVWNDDDPPPGEAAVGETISYTIKVTNNGNVTLTSVAVTDPLITGAPNSGTITCPGGNPIPSLAPAAFVNCTATYTVTQIDVNNGSVDNTATATSGNTTDFDDENVILPAEGSLAIVKTGVWDDDGSIPTEAEVGETITYTFAVTNNGAISLSNVAVTDPLITGPPNSGSIDCSPEANPILNLDPTDTVPCTGTYAITQADIDAGEVNNTGTADSDETVPVDDDETVTLPQNPAVEIVKAGSYEGDPAGAVPGDMIDYTFTVTNTGNVTLHNIAVSDPKVSTITCTGGNPIPSLAPQAFVECTGSYTLAQGDIDAGTVHNTATAVPDEGPPDDDEEDVPVPQNPSMTIDKTSGTTEITAPGEVLYSYLVTNTGNVTLTNIALSDDNDNEDMSCPATELAPSDTMNCSASHTVTQAEIDANGSPDAASGVLYNLVTGLADQFVKGINDDLSIPIIQSPAMTIEKASVTTGLSAPGAVTYSYLVTNTGNVTLTNIALSDDNDNDDISCEADTLAPGAQMSCSATHTVTQQELDANGSPTPESGNLTNIVSGTADELGEPVTDDLDIPMDYLPAMTVEKTSATTEVTGTGAVTYNYLVSNTGNITLTGIALSDTNDEDDMSCPGTSLAPAANMQCSATHNVTQQELEQDGSPTPDSGVLYNQVTASSEEAEDATDDLSIPINYVKPAQFRVTKHFTDGNPMDVEVEINCFTGLPLTQTQAINENRDVVFIVQSFSPGELDCDITEVVPTGYSPTYTASATETGIGLVDDDESGCHYDDVVGGGFVCAIVNTPNAVDVVIEKLWVLEGNGGDEIDTRYELTLYCDGEILDDNDQCGDIEGTFRQVQDSWCKNFHGDDSYTFTAQVVPEYPYTYCHVVETVYDNAVEVDNGCENITVSAAEGGDSCLITNTVFFEGIPALSQYGMAVLAILMLGMGFVGFRRFI